MPVPRTARAAQAAIGRHWALLMQGFFADGVAFPPLIPDEPQALVVDCMSIQNDPEAQQGRPHQH